MSKSTGFLPRYSGKTLVIAALVAAMMLAACGPDTDAPPATTLIPSVDPMDFLWKDAADPETGRVFRCLIDRGGYGIDNLWCYEVAQ